MRIGYNGRFLYPARKVTGVERVGICLLENILAADRRNEYIIFAGSKESLGVPLPSGSTTRVIEQSLLKRGGVYGHLWEQIRLPMLVNQYCCDIMLNPVNTAPLISIPSVLYLHDISFLINPQWFSAAFRHYYTMLIPMLARRAKRIVTVSQNSKSDIIRLLGVDASKIKVVYNAPNAFFLDSDRSENESVLNSLKVKRPYILFTGSLDPRKNLFNLIRAFILAKQKSPAMKHSLVIAGVGGRNFNKVHALSENSHVDVQYLGYITDCQLRSLYQEAELFTYPSLYEGFGLPPIEAMACGCPVLVSKTSSLPEVCGDAAMYIDPGSIENMAQAILRIVEDSSLKTSLQGKGIERARLFSWEKSANEMIRIFEEVYSETCHNS